MKFPGCKMHAHASRQRILRSSSTSAVSAMRLDENPFTCSQSGGEKRRSQKGLRVSDFALLSVVFKWHHGSEGVKESIRDLGWRTLAARSGNHGGCGTALLLCKRKCLEECREALCPGQEREGRRPTRHRINNEHTAPEQQ